MANTTKTDTRNVVQKSPLGRIAPGAGPDPDRIEVDNILESVNAQVTPIFEMTESSTPDLVLNIGSWQIQDPEYLHRRTIPPISGELPSPGGLTVTFPASSGGNAVPSSGDPITITITSGNRIKVGINLDKDGDLVLNTGVEGASENDATVPPLVPNTHAIGYVVLHNDGGTIQNITNTAIYQYEGGGGGSGGLATETQNANFTAEDAKHYLVDCTGGAIAVTLPPGVEGAIIRISDINGDSEANNITITPDGSETIDGDSNLIIDVNYGWVHLTWDGTEWGYDTAQLGFNAQNQVLLEDTAANIDALIPYSHGFGDIPLIMVCKEFGI